MSSKFAGYFYITRPLNVLLGSLSIYIGFFVASPFQFPPSIFFACLSGALILAGGNAINDYFDLAIDRINKPRRPIPASLVSPAEALKFAIILFTFGLFVSIFATWALFGVAILAVAGLFYYSVRLKRTVLWGNITVSFFAGLAFVYGGLASDNYQKAMIPACFAFLFHLGREIIKDVEDVEADKANGVLTLPIVYGQTRALFTATAVYVVLIALTFVPYMMKIYETVYLTVVMLGVDLILVLLLFFMWKYPLSDTFRRISFILKIDMFVGLMAIVAGTVESNF